MKVGILSSCQHSMFSGGNANTTIALIEMMKMLKYDVTLLNTNHSVDWYDDVKLLKTQIQVLNITKDTAAFEELFDLIIETVPFFENETMRKKYGKQFVYFYRSNILIPFIEHSLYPIVNNKPNYDGISQIWCFDKFCDNDELQILQLLTRKPVLRLPYVWTPSIIESHKSENSMPIWIQFQNMLKEQHKENIPKENVPKENVSWNPHIFETNVTSTSSCTIGLLVLKQAKEHGFDCVKYKVHNADQVYKSQFFKDNILKHSETSDLSGEFVGRQRICDLVLEPKSVVISHIRLIPFKPMLFDMGWMGIPFIHNSEVLKHITCFERYYYHSNKISEASECLKRIDEDFKTGVGWFDLENVQNFRKHVLENYSCLNSKIVEEYSTAINNIFNTVSTSIVPKKEKYYLMFTDFWPDFHYSYNFFTLLLDSINHGLDIEYVNESTIPKDVMPNAIVFSLFGESWKNYPTVPKIHFTGENTMPVEEASVKLNLCFQHSDMVSDNYLRFPLWLLEIDWFGCDVEKISNPKPIPLERFTKKFPEEKKEKFCAFIVSNPTNDLRNNAFFWLNEYKPVDSAGRLFNTMGSDLFAGGGGGGGELRKHEFLKKYKFCFAFENSSSQGYVTEKLIHAKAAGCIPIYWGDPKVERDFDPKSFIDARKIRSKEELIQMVKEIDENSEKYQEMFNTPALDDYHLDWAKRTIAECGSRILKILTSTHVEVPRFIQTKESVKPVNKSLEIQAPLMVTYATREFLPSLNQWLSSVGAQTRIVPDLKARIYLGHDVSEESKKKLLEAFPFIELASLPDSVSSDFPDLYDAQHYAWKIYIYQDLANNVSSRMVFYIDAGAFLCRWPSDYLRISQENDICVLEDNQQLNEQWCHETCVKKMKISNDELKQHQIVGGIMCFRTGVQKVKDYFNEAWNYAQMRDVIVGEKWSGIRDGKPYGHRHDQSILSVLSLRYNLAKYPLHTLYCDVSLRRTFISNKYIYVHRGNFKIHEEFLPKIDDCFVINLQRRKDRLERLYTNSPEFQNKIIEFEAYEGRKIQMTKALARLFKPHDFMWKKAIMGCALSHLNLWFKLATDKPEINSYLILEDDVKFKTTWQKIWAEAAPHIPENFDVIYLGGILPPNRAGFEKCKEPVNKYFSRVKENSFFGQNPSNRYFHWCAYAYVVSKQGAQKILDVLMARDGYYTSADHMICNPIDYMNIYFLDPLIAGCYQDEDPKYMNSDFNNFNRVDGFDSDLWNNDERFTPEEIGDNSEGDIDIVKALTEARNYKVETDTKETVINAPIKKSRFYSLKEYDMKWNELHEYKWLLEMLGTLEFVTMNYIEHNEVPDVENPIFIIVRSQDYSSYFKNLEMAGKEFSIIHLGDEYQREPIEFYDYKSCKAVVRNYVRSNLNQKVLVIPLGYHTSFGKPIENPLERTPQLPFRTKTWSFFGTNWIGVREAILEPLKQFEKHSVILFNKWNDPNNISEKEYLSYMLDTIFVPCIGGNNAETFRFYEALECGCVPILVEDQQTKEYCNYIKQYIPITCLQSWAQASALIQQLLNDKQTLEVYRSSLLQAYRTMKQMLKEQVKKSLEI
uniref:Uncharacterized protein n=1 Tax=viral metagenome TaxID=1070528 RepID=A0A6C0D7M6_9ZZZZ